MSRMQLEQFFDLVERDEGLQDQLKVLHHTPQLPQDVVNIGAGRGFAFTVQDVEHWIREAIGKSEDELSDRQLESVAGGTPNGDIPITGVYRLC